MTRRRRFERREEMKRLRFEALHYAPHSEGRKRHTSFGPFHPAGPLLGRHLRLPAWLEFAVVAVREPGSAHVYALRRNEVVRYDTATGEGGVIAIPKGWPQAREAVGLAVDTRRRRLLFASRDRVGYLYAFDLARETWSVLGDLDRLDLAGLTYDARRDTLYGVSFAPRRLQVHRFASDGRRLGTSAVAVRPPEDRRTPLQLACVEGRLIVLYPPVRDRQGRTWSVTRAHVVAPWAGEVLSSAVQRPHTSPAPLTPVERWRSWSRLAGRDWEVALQRLADGGLETVRFVAQRLRTARQPPAAIERWLRLLAHDRSTVRAYAQAQLERLDTLAVGHLTSALLTEDAPELRAGAQRALTAIRARASPSTHHHRALRAVRVLELIDAPESVAVLEELARREDARATAARQALRRLRCARR
ncbi:MAG: hypothetical protein ACYTEZ_17235 [Planctomycetota bacterium]